MTRSLRRAHKQLPVEVWLGTSDLFANGPEIDQHKPRVVADLLAPACLRVRTGRCVLIDSLIFAITCPIT
jgi:hypothetical protein